MTPPHVRMPASRRYSLRWRLPLLISGLTALVLVSFLWAAYRRVEATLVQSARERAQSAADQVALLLAGGRSAQVLQSISDDRDLRTFLQTQSPEARTPAEARLKSLAGNALRRVELWDADGSLMLEVSMPGASAAGTAKTFPRGTAPSAAGVSPLQSAAGTVFVDTVTEIRDDGAAARPLGYVRIRSTFNESPPGIFSRLVGQGASVKVGNRSGDIWTDFSRVEPAASVDLTRRGLAQYRASDGDMRLGAVSLIADTPWSAWVEFRLATIVAPARDFLQSMLVVALGFVTVSALLVVALAARITKPLAEMNTAAKALATGDYSRRVTARRRDEIGQLARSFNAMAADVQASAHALRESEARFRSMAETLPHIVWTAGPDGRFEYFNQHWFEYTGLTVADAQGAAWMTLLHPEDRDETAARWTHAVAMKEPHAVSFRLKRASDGAYRWHTSRAVPLTNEAGAIVAWVGTITDVDDQRRAQDALQQLNTELEQRVAARTAELQTANQELESFSYSVSHDLRAPLRHVQGYVELLTAALDGQLSEKPARYLKTITDATVEMGDLIDDLLAFSRIGRAQMSQGRVPLDSLVRGCIEGLEMATRNRSIVWKLPQLPDVIGDPSMLKQVFANLLGNAVKYTRQRETAEIEVGYTAGADGQVVLFVRDNGAGFDMRYADKLFGVFQRLHRADEFEGTGIGLATVRRIISRHGGRVWAEGKVNEGATVYFTLTHAAEAALASEL
jgi:PAS domain S-box-containing protein